MTRLEHRHSSKNSRISSRRKSSTHRSSRRKRKSRRRRKSSDCKRKSEKYDRKSLKRLFARKKSNGCNRMPPPRKKLKIGDCPNCMTSKHIITDFQQGDMVWKIILTFSDRIIFSFLNQFGERLLKRFEVQTHFCIFHVTGLSKLRSRSRGPHYWRLPRMALFRLRKRWYGGWRR